ncbi:MAG: SAM-dependent methyltransferase [Clostridiaceae bacterium]|jgi:tRNA (adenine22-N1)-methyltransferase|nr:SAM-dependent methyltransferase [Clostridiaceae bacterium]
MAGTDRTAPVRLSPRLQAAAGLIAPCQTVYDIGTDHAWLPVWLVENGVCQQAVAADLRTGPLERARANILSRRLDGRIKTRQGDGLAGLAPAPDDAVVLAGLGGLEIRRIVAQAHPVLAQLIVQPMKTLPELRQWLVSQGYSICQEALARERGRFYPVIKLRYEGSCRPLTDLEAWLGPCLLRDKPAGLAEYAAVLLHRLQRQLRGQPDLKSLAGQIAQLAEKGALSDEHG